MSVTKLPCELITLFGREDWNTFHKEDRQETRERGENDLKQNIQVSHDDGGLSNIFADVLVGKNFSSIHVKLGIHMDILAEHRHVFNSRP